MSACATDKEVNKVEGFILIYLAKHYLDAIKFAGLERFEPMEEYTEFAMWGKSGMSDNGLRIARRLYVAEPGTLSLCP